MSDETKQAVEDAIRAHLVDENPDLTLLLTDWYVMTAAVIAEEDDATHYMHINSGAPWHVLVGLVHRAWSRMASWSDCEDLN